MSYYSPPSYNTTTTSSSASPSNRNHNHNRNNNPSSSSQKTQDQQAGDKDLSYSSSSSSSHDDKKCSLPFVYHRRHEDYATLQKRREAAVILDNPELLLMYSNARNDSLAGTRYHFTRIFCGLPDDEEEVDEEESSRKIQKS